MFVNRANITGAYTETNHLYCWSETVNNHLQCNRYYNYCYSRS